MGTFRLALILAIFALAQPFGARGAVAQDLEPEVVRRHEMKVGGHALAYTSHAGRVPIRVGGTEDVRAKMFYVAYRVRPAAGERRPLTIIWNGGPGGSMLSMLTGGQGPKRIEAGTVMDNDDTLLRETDLLYIDAVGTGFSRPSAVGTRAEFFQTRGDNDAFVECILGWRRLYDAEEQPIYLAGVSWGAYRVAAVAEALAKRGVDVGGGVAMAGRNGLAKADAELRLLPLGIVQMPRIARLHGKGQALEPRGIDDVEAEVSAWAREEYLPALKRLESLAPGERDAIVTRLSLYSGLPAARINRTSLIVSPRDLTDGLLAAEGKVLAQFDMRRASPSPAGPGPASSAVRRRSPAERYVRHALGYATSLAYLPLAWDAARMEGYLPAGAHPPDWNYLDGYYDDDLDRPARAARNEELESLGYAPGGQEQRLAAAAMLLEPEMRMVVIHGRFDGLPSSCASAEAQLAEIEPDLRRRVEFLCVDSGHALFVGEPSIRRQINAAFRSLWLHRS